MHHYIFRYIKVVALNVARDHCRSVCAQRRGKNAQMVELTEAGEGHSPIHRNWASTFDRELALKAIWTIVYQVTAGCNTDRDRTIFKLYYEEGFTNREIANFRDIGLTLQGVAGVIFRITKAVRRVLAGGNGAKKE